MLDMINAPSVDFLFTSGKPYRFNTAGIECIYFAENEKTARAEYERHNLRGDQPLTTYFADVHISHLLDLCDPRTRKVFKLTLTDLRKAWVGAARPTSTQLIGRAVSAQTRIAAIRFPSDAARRSGFEGANLVIFQSSLTPPDFLEIVGPEGKVLQRWRDED